MSVCVQGVGVASACTFDKRDWCSFSEVFKATRAIITVGEGFGITQVQQTSNDCSGLSMSCALNSDMKAAGCMLRDLGVTKMPNNFNSGRADSRAVGGFGALLVCLWALLVCAGLPSLCFRLVHSQPLRLSKCECPKDSTPRTLTHLHEQPRTCTQVDPCLTLNVRAEHVPSEW
jgi:hypothetical protein